MSPAPPRSFVRAFTVPIALAIVTTIGLLTALLGGPGLWEWTSWIALALPIALTLYCMARGRLN